MRRIWSGVAVVGVVAVAAGCGGTRTVTVTEPAASSKAPPAPLALGLPTDYRAKQVMHADLSGGPVPDVVVTSVGPAVTPLGFHSADLRVLEWDPLVHRWGVAFDAQKVMPPPESSNPANSNSGPGYYPDTSDTQPPTPLLDPKADVTLGPVRAGRLLPGKRQQLVFSASANYGGSGVPAVLAVVDFKNGIADVAYTWGGEGLWQWRLADGVLHAQASYWTPADPHCCAIRKYDFAVKAKHGYLTEIQDQRPWLGITVRQLGGDGAKNAPLKVVSIDDNAPAKGHLRVGDVLVKVLNPPAHRKDIGALASPLFDELSLFDAGQTAKLRVQRAGSEIVVSVPLGSLKDSYGTSLPSNDLAVQAL